MTGFLPAWSRRGIALTVLSFLFLGVALAGCGGQPERTEDPAEIEKLRQEHVKQAQREWEDNQRSP